MLAVVLLPAAPVVAHESDDETPWGEDPADIVVTEDCSVMQRNFVATYAVDHRLDAGLASQAVKFEVVSVDAVVTGFTIASPGWRTHTEQPDSAAHAERRSILNTSNDLLLRFGLEHRDAASPETIAFELRVFLDGRDVPEVFPLEAPSIPDAGSPFGAELFRQWCHEPVLPLSVSAPTSSSGSGGVWALGGGVSLALLGLGILGATGVLLLRRRRR
jgi:hypothetical protein